MVLRNHHARFMMMTMMNARGGDGITSTPAVDYILLLQRQQRRDQQLMMKLIILRKRIRLQHAYAKRHQQRFDRHVRYPSIHNDHCSIATPNDLVNTMENVVEDLPTTINFPTKITLSPTTVVTPPRTRGKRDRNENVDGAEAADLTNPISPSSFYRHALVNLSQANDFWNQIAIRTMKHEVQYVRESFNRMMNETSTSHDDNDTIKVPDLSLPSPSISSSSTAMEHRTAPDIIKSLEHNVDNTKVIKEHQHQDVTECDQSIDESLKQTWLHKQKQQQQSLKQFYERSSRVKRMTMLFRQINTYQSMLHSEMQACVGNDDGK